MSSSSRTLPVVHEPSINAGCVLRRNLKRQPYGRCSVCTLKYPQCHALQASGVSFVLVVLILSTVVASGWVDHALVVAVLGLLTWQGRNTHERTDELIHSAHRLRAAGAALEERNAELRTARDDLERQVAERTAELRARNVELARANLELMQRAEQRSRLVVDLSHELRTPLTSIKGSAQNLIDGIAGKLNADQLEYMEIIRDQSNRLIDEARTIIEAARGDEVRVELRLAEIDLMDLIADVRRRLEPSAIERGLALALVSGEPRLPARVDEAKVRTVVENLVSNAIKFTDPGGEITIDVRATESEARIEVRDTGVGIAPDELPKMFQRFVRGSTDRPGTGVGLSVSRELARLHGGEIHASSEPGKGSEFVVSLPRVAA